MKKCYLQFFVIAILAQPNLAQTITDYDGNVYNTVAIGDQFWMAENLKSLHYADGTSIDSVWAYNNEPDSAEIYGLLYTWEAAMNHAPGSNLIPSGVQGACPVNWHLPSEEEWRALVEFLGGEYVAGGKMKESGTSHWEAPNTGATNESGFTGLPGGRRGEGDGFQVMGLTGFWWSSNLWSDYAYLLAMGTEIEYCVIFGTYNMPGYIDAYSVRCLRDGPVRLDDIRSDVDLFRLSPNPATDQLIISMDGNINGKLYIYGYDGRLYHQSEIYEQTEIIDISSLNSGIYIVRVKTKYRTDQGTFIKY